MKDCIVIPFPLASRKVMIDRLARHASAMSPAAAERLFQQQLKIQAEVLQRRGVAGDDIQREVDQLKHALRARLAQRRGSQGAT
ncbi:hypothetical protein V1290_000366 [Bradyrhizobium sp. AZCC 1578]|uniref:DUF6074 family protein n=1 Tax=Bradyrhizobium sp. AZCC 1578 TaxID=3117027 RepID=UPI002FF1EE7E